MDYKKILIYFHAKLEYTIFLREEKIIKIKIFVAVVGIICWKINRHLIRTRKPK